MYRIRVLLFIVLFGGITHSMRGQEYRFELGALAGVSSYLGDANPRNPFTAMGANVNLMGRYNYNFRVAFSSELGYFLAQGTSLRNPKNHFPKNAQGKFVTNGALLSLCAEYNFYPYSDKYPFLQTKRFTPFVSGGLSGGLAFQNKSVAFLPGVNIGLGVKWKIRNRLNLIAKLDGIHFFSDKLDTSSKSSAFLSNPYHTKSSFIKGGDGMVRLMVGISYEFKARGTNCNKNEQISR